MKSFPTKKEFDVSYEDVDYNSHLRMSELFTYLSRTATVSAIENGFYSKEVEGKYGFVLVKQTLKFNRPISLNEKITIITTPYKARRVQAFRTYEIEDSNNKNIGGVYSVWALIDIKKRELTSLDKVGMDKIEFGSYTPTVDNFTKIISIDTKKVETRKVRISDIDTNKHMNNARYIEWANDLFDFNSSSQYYVEELSVHYLKECYLNDDVDLYLGIEGQNFLVEFKQGDETNFKASGKLKKI